MPRGADRIFLGRVALSIALLITGCRRAVGLERRPINVNVVRVSLADSQSVLSLTGEVRAKVEEELSFRVGGKVIERRVDVGSSVAARAVLARLDSRQSAADVAVSQAALLATQSTLRQAQLEFVRERQLLAQSAVSEAAFDAAERDFHAAQGAFAAAQADLDKARDAATFTELRAARPGVITTRSVEVGQVVAAGAPVFSLAESGPRDAVFKVQEGAANALVGRALELTLVDDPRVQARGVVREISPLVDGATGTVTVKVAIENIPPEMSLKSAVVGNLVLKASKTVTLPSAAVASDNGEPAVWVVDPASKKVKLRRVMLDNYASSSIVVRQGLADGELVVTEGASRLRPAQAVAFASEGPA